MSKSIILSELTTKNNRPNELNLQFATPLISEKEEVCLNNLYVYFSWYNLTDQFNNKTGVSYIWDGIEYPIVFPDGFFSVENLSGYIQARMKENGHYVLDADGEPMYFLSLVANEVHYAVSLTATPISLPVGGSNPNNIVLSGQTPQLKITNPEWGKLIGFNTGTFPSSPSSSVFYQNSSSTPIIHPVSVIGVHLPGFVYDRYSSYSDLIATFTVPNDTRFGQQIAVSPPNPLFYPIIDGTHTQIRLELRDQLNRPLGCRDKMFATIVVRPRKI